MKWRAPRIVCVLALLSLVASPVFGAGRIPPPEVEWMPGEALVKLRPAGSAGLAPSAAPGESIAALSAATGMAAEVIITTAPEATAKTGVSSATWVLLRGDRRADVPALVEHLRSIPGVETAEPNYIMRIVAAEAGGASRAVLPQAAPNDPKYSEQWGLPYIEAPAAWAITQGSPSQVIAVIDTGIDLDHPDLASKLWTNPVEAAGDKNGDGCPGLCGVDDDVDGRVDEDGQGRQPGEVGYDPSYRGDDDENGYIDDLRGWNFVGASNNPQDDNGHGTFCAGIAAAATGNGIGIAGTCPLCRVMALKAFASNGTAAYSDIAKAVDYAWKNGATVLSMSFSSPADSSLVRDALNTAYSRATLVAAAGNDRASRTRALCEASGIDYPVRPSYPANYTFVLGVEAEDEQGRIASFSNCQYPLRAPGVEITSAVLNDTFASWSGTSMAAPFVAGVAGLLRALKAGDPTWNAGLIFGQLLKSGGNALLALTLGPQPKLQFEGWHVLDTAGSCGSCDGDGSPDAGERVSLVVTVRNTWANATGVTGTLTTSSGNATIVDGSASFGSIGASTTDNNSDNPFVIDISPSALNDTAIDLNLTVTPANGPESLVAKITLRVQRGAEKGGSITANETWTSNNLYLVTDSIFVEEGATLTIQPGTTVRVNAGKAISVRGGLVARGTPAQPIVFEGNGASWSGIVFQSVSTPAAFASGVYQSGCAIEYARIGDCSGAAAVTFDDTWIARNVFTANESTYGVMSATATTPRIEQNLFTGNQFGTAAIGALTPGDYLDNTVVGNTGDAVRVAGTNTIRGNSIFSNSGYEVRRNDGTDGTVANNYWGTTTTSAIDSEIYDFFDDKTATLGRVTFAPPLTAPSPLAPPVVASLALDPPSPVGSGRITMTATMSRPMDTTAVPQMFFGPAAPYTRPVSLSAGWVGGSDVKVTSPGGSATLAGGFTFVAAPSVASITPSTGTTAGNTYVTITGANLAGATSVTFGDAAATIVTNSPSSITVTTPAHVAGTVSVVVTTPGGSATTTNAFTYGSS